MHNHVSGTNLGGGVNENDWRMLHRIYNIVTYYNLAACYQRRGLFKDS
jgi:hypothetical protein